MSFHHNDVLEEEEFDTEFPKMTNATNDLMESWLSSRSEISEKLNYLKKILESTESEEGENENENDNSAVLLGLSSDHTSENAEVKRKRKKKRTRSKVESENNKSDNKK